MKKYLTPIIVLSIVGAGIFIRYSIVAPARGATRDLSAINGLTAGQTTEAELLGRSAFQTIDRTCFGAECVYHMERENTFLSKLHLAPYTFFSTAVTVRNGVVIEVSVMMNKDGLPPISMTQTMKLPPGCVSSPCVQRAVLPSKAVTGVRILFSNESDLRNRMPEAAQSACLSRMHGCKTYDELMPLAKELNLEATAQ